MNVKSAALEFIGYKCSLQLGYTVVVSSSITHFLVLFYQKKPQTDSKAPPIKVVADNGSDGCRLTGLTDEDDSCDCGI